MLCRCYVERLDDFKDTEAWRNLVKIINWYCPKFVVPIDMDYYSTVSYEDIFCIYREDPIKNVYRSNVYLPIPVPRDIFTTHAKYVLKEDEEMKKRAEPLQPGALLQFGKATIILYDIETNRYYEVPALYGTVVNEQEWVYATTKVYWKIDVTDINTSRLYADSPRFNPPDAIKELFTNIK